MRKSLCALFLLMFLMYTHYFVHEITHFGFLDAFRYYINWNVENLQIIELTRIFDFQKNIVKIIGFLLLKALGAKEGKM